MKATQLLKLGNALLGEFPANDAGFLLAHCLKINHAEIPFCNAEVLRDIELRYRELIDKRKTGLPVPYITGETEFMGLKFFVSKDVLIPRQETEILVEKIIKITEPFTVYRPPFTALDLGTGSGNIAVSLARYISDIRVVAVDVSKNALATAEKNAKLNNVSDKIIFWHADILSDPFLKRLPLTEYDFIVSNPPYIKSSEIPGLPAEVRFEPQSAIEGGEDGMKFYERIVPESRKLLKKNGWLVMEIGHWHSRQVKKIMYRCGYDKINVLNDYSGEERVIYGQNCN